MTVRLYTVTLLSETELIMDRDNITFAEEVSRWHKDPVNADVQRPGDDRAPAWTWLGKLHYGESDGLIGLPQGLLGSCLRAAATMIPHPTAKGKKSLKEVSQSGILFTQTSFPLYVQQPGVAGWHPIPFRTLYDKLSQEDEFEQHLAIARACGIRLDVRRSKPQFNRSHVRVRPFFGPWRCVVAMQLIDDLLTSELMLQVLRTAGMYKGIGNWRPSLSKAGSYGTFHVEEGVSADLAHSEKVLRGMA